MTVVGDTTVAIPTRVLVLGMAHEDGTIVAEELPPVAEACGLTADQVRSCLRRLVGDGLFVRQGTGRATVFAATEQGLAALGANIERTRLAYGQDAAGSGWDREWRLVAFAVPERDRAARDAFRDHLLGLGGAALQGGLYVSPHPWHKDVRAEAERLGIGGTLVLATTDDLDVGGEHDPRRLAALLWPVEELAAGYEHFNRRHHHVPDVLLGMRSRREQLRDRDFLPAALGDDGGLRRLRRAGPVAAAGAAPAPVARTGGPRAGDDLATPRARPPTRAGPARAVPLVRRSHRHRPLTTPRSLP